MRKLVFYGDGLLCPPHGYGESLVDLLVLQRPESPFQTFQLGEENFGVETALRDAPFHVIGKAPHLVYLGLGQADLLAGTPPEIVFSSLEGLIALLAQKTGALVAIASACEAFFPADGLRENAGIFNAKADALRNSRTLFLDLNAPVNAFLERHRPGTGEKRALHREPLRLTSTGRAFLARTAFDLLPWESLFSTF